MQWHALICEHFWSEPKISSEMSLLLLEDNSEEISANKAGYLT